MKYILAIDQSTSGTKALLFDEDARLICRSDLPHKQKISENGWVAHDPMEIWENTKGVARAIIEKPASTKTKSLASASATSARRLWFGIAIPAFRFMMRSYGSAHAVQRSVKDCLIMPKWCASTQVCGSLHISLRQRSHGFYRTLATFPADTFVAARLIRGSSLR